MGKSEYVFHGRIYPERTDVHIGPGVQVGSGQTQIDIKITSSQILARAEFPGDLENIYTMKNIVEKSVYKLTDMFSFVEGYSYNIEITSVVMPNGDSHVFGVGIPALKDKSQELSMEDQINRIIEIQQELDSDYLHRCFKDLRLSMQDPSETGLFCYRSLETIRKYFQNEYAIEDDSEGWIKMRNELGIDQSKIDPVKEYADPRRHGGRVEISGEDRADTFSRTWDIVDLFLSYLEEKHL